MLYRVFGHKVTAEVHAESGLAGIPLSLPNGPWQSDLGMYV